MIYVFYIPTNANQQHIVLYQQAVYGGVLGHGGTPSHHPFLDGISPYKPTILGGTTMYGNPHIAP